MKVRSELLDVNVHPTKMEIRFRNGSEIYELLVHEIKRSTSFQGFDSRSGSKKREENPYKFL